MLNNKIKPTNIAEMSFFFVRQASYPGNVIGTIHATDGDAGADGFVRYEMSANNDYFGVDAEKGAVVLRRALDYAAFSEDVGAGVIRLSVVARSNKPGSLTDTAQVTVTVDPALLPVILQSAQGPVPAWLQVSFVP